MKVAYNNLFFVLGLCRQSSGSWFRKIDRLNLEKDNGFMFIGEFFNVDEKFNEFDPGLYLDRDTVGTGHKKKFHHTLVELLSNGDIKKIKGPIIKGKKDQKWALEFKEEVLNYQDTKKQDQKDIRKIISNKRPRKIVLTSHELKK